MSDMFLVQKDGLNPPEARRTTKQPRRKFPVEDMAVGDRFFVPGKSGKSVSSYISRITKDLPGKYTTRADWARPVSMVGGKRKWESCAETDGGSEEGVTVTRVE